MGAYKISHFNAPGGGIFNPNAVVDLWINLDGRLNAPAGAPQYPHDLDLNPATQTFGHTLVSRAPWKVAGVDYAVGIRPSVILKDPFSSYTNATTGTLVAALTAIGGSYPSVVAGSQVIEFSGASANNAVLSGYDFSLHGGVGIEVYNCSGFTITDCNFFNGTGLIAAQATMVSLSGPANGVTPASSLTLQYSVIDGNQAGGTYLNGFGSIESNGIGNQLIQYCWLKGAWAENIVYGVGAAAGTVNFTMQFNIIENAGYGFASGAHGDWIQLVNSNSGAAGGTLNSASFLFNLWRQKEQAGGGGTQGLSLMSANETQSPTTTAAVQNNTFMTAGTNSVNEFIFLNTSCLSGSGTNSQNYMDPTGIISGGWYWLIDTTSGGFNGGFNGTVTGSGNINMLTGATITPVGADRGYP